MYSKEAFRAYVEAVNHALFPFHIVAYLLTILFVWLVIRKPGPKVDLALKTWLSLHFIILGIANLVLVDDPLMKHDFTKAALLCFIIGALFLADIFLKRIQFTAGGNRTRSLLLFTGYVLFVYPCIEWLITGNIYRVSYYGAFPCPTLIFSLALLSSALPDTDRKVYVVLLLFAVSAGIYGPLRNQVYANLGTGAVGIYSLVLLVLNWNKIGRRSAAAAGHGRPFYKTIK